MRGVFSLFKDDVARPLDRLEPMASHRMNVKNVDRSIGEKKDMGGLTEPYK